MSISKEIVNVSEDEKVEYLIILPVVTYEQFSIERPGNLTKKEIIRSITPEEANHDDDILHTLAWKERNKDGTFSDTLFWHNDIQIDNEETGEEVL